MAARESAALVLHISAPRMQAAAVVVVLRARVELVAAARVVAALLDLEPLEPQTRAAVAVAQERHHQELALVARVAKALSLFAIPARQLALLLVQQTRQHNLAVSPSIISLKMERW
jgi:hypothetical protein